ncbi:Siderophore-interacting protein [compost metagenome]
MRIQVRNPADQRVLASAAKLDLQWVSALPAAVEALALPTGAGFVWAAGEHSEMSAVRRAMLAKPGVDAKRMRISAYWKRGAADHHEDLVQ